MKSFISNIALVGAGIFVFAVAGAQDQASTGTNTGVRSGEQIEEVVVTVSGSRIIRNGNNAPTPVMVITPDQLLATKPTTLYENLVDMPQFAGSRGAANGPPQGGSDGQTGLSLLNLRHLGADRNLVLLDGHRLPPVTADGLVDVGAIPEMLIQRVDVVTGGASAVYGSDAITGVTNFVVNRNFNGVKIDGQAGVSDKNDASATDFALAAGTELFNGRGHIEFSWQSQYDAGLKSDQRDWAQKRWTVQGNGGSVPYEIVAYAANATASYGGTIACSSSSRGTLNPSRCPGDPLVGMSFNDPGVLTPYDYGTPTSRSAVQIGGDGVFFRNVSIRSEQQRDQGFFRFDYDLKDDLHFSLTGSGTKRFTRGSRGTQRTFPPGWTMGACNAFLPSQYQDALGCTPANAGTVDEPTFQFEKAFDPPDHFGMGQNSELTAKYRYFLASLEGAFGDGWRWDVNYTHSTSAMDVYNLNQTRDHIAAGLDAVVNPANGEIVCAVDLNYPGMYPGCVPINMFGPLSTTKEMMDYIMTWVHNQTDTTLNGLSFSISAEPWQGWAGPIGVAFSGEYRKLEMSLDSTARADDYLTCVGLRFGQPCRPGVTIPNGGALIPIKGVTQEVSEAAVEVNVPLLENLSFNGAARYTKYKNDPNDSDVVSRTFNVDTWKMGIVWHINDELRLRVSQSQDIRAPDLLSLYEPSSVGNPGFVYDYLLIGEPLLAVPPVGGGNPYLDPEKGTTNAVGVVWVPSPSFSLAADFYSIKLEDALFSLNGSNESVQRACYASGGSSPLCQLQDRPNGFQDTSASNAMTAYYTRNINIASQKTSGIDLEANFSTDLFDRPFTLRAVINHVTENKITRPFDATYEVAGVAYPGIGGLPTPDWAASIYASYQVNDQLMLRVGERWRNSMAISERKDAEVIGDVASVAYTNLTLSYDVPLASTGTRLNVFLNVQNLFDTDPPKAGEINENFPGSFPGVYAHGDDVLGRYFVFGVKVQL